MPLAGSAARRYAEALIDIASEEDAVPAYRASLERLRDALGPGILRALRDPSVRLGRRTEALQAAAKDEPAAIRSLLVLLLERDRIALLAAIALAFGEIVDRREGIVKAKITTAVEVDVARRDGLVERLERASGSRIRATFAVDPSLIGGAKVQLGDRLIDASLRAQLAALGRQLAS